MAWAFSIQKSQGLSLNKIFIDIDCDIFESGMCYVALSRARNLNNITILDLNEEKLYCNSLAVDEYNRLYKKFMPLSKTITCFNTVLENSQNQINYEKFIQKNLLNNCSVENDVRSYKQIYYFLLLSNDGSNACFANVIMQTILACHKQILNEVFYLLLQKIIFYIIHICNEV